MFWCSICFGLLYNHTRPYQHRWSKNEVLLRFNSKMPSIMIVVDRFVNSFNRFTCKLDQLDAQIIVCMLNKRMRKNTSINVMTRPRGPTACQLCPHVHICSWMHFYSDKPKLIGISFEVFLKWRYPQMVGVYWKISLRWMIWGTPILGNLHLIGGFKRWLHPWECDDPHRSYAIENASLRKLPVAGQTNFAGGPP